MYKIKLYDDEINKINNLEVFKTTKKALMSIYAYFLKLGANTKDGLKISFDDIFNRYRRWHVFTKTKANFVKLSYKLIDLGLLKVEKKGNKNIYFARKSDSSVNENSAKDSNDNLFADNGVNIGVNKEVQEEVNVKNTLQSSMNTNFKEGELDTQIINTKTNNYITIIKDTEMDNSFLHSNNQHEEVKLSNYEKAIIENNKEKLDYIQASSLGFDILEERNIKIEKIRNKVIDTLIRLDNVIVKKNAKAYIETIVNNACKWYERNRIGYATKVKENKSKNRYLPNSYFLNEMTLDEIEKIFD